MIERVCETERERQKREREPRNVTLEIDKNKRTGREKKREIATVCSDITIAHAPVPMPQGREHARVTGAARKDKPHVLPPTLFF